MEQRGEYRQGGCIVHGAHRRCLYLQYKHEVDPTTYDSMGTIEEVSHGTQFPEWRRVDEEDMIKIRAVKEEEFWKTDFDSHCWWSCSLCPNFDERSDEMAIHLEET